MTPDRLIAALEQHACIAQSHPGITEPAFLPALKQHLFALPLSARGQAITYLGEHHVPGFASLLLQQFPKADLNDRINIVHVLSDLPDLPPAAELLAGLPIAPVSDNPTFRRYFYRALLKSTDAPAALAALRKVRPQEKDKLASVTADLVAVKLGGDSERAVVMKTLGELSVEEVRQMDDVYAIGKAPALAPLFKSWLDDKRDVGTFSHRETRNFKVRDLGLWAIQCLGVVVPGAPADHMTHADDAMIASAKKAVQ